MQRKTAFYIIAVCFVTLIFSIIGCNRLETGSGSILGVSIPEGEPVIRLASVLENPAAYSTGPIVLKGRVSGQCASLCEFFFQEGIHSVTIYPQGFKLPKLERGKNVTIYTQVISGKGQVVFSAIGLRME